jgi:hypothetical protein
VFVGFIRAKTIKGKEYGYLVSNTWTANGSRQSVKAYLGRIICPSKAKEETIDINKLEYSDAVLALIKQELKNHGFNDSLAKDKTKVDLENRKIINNNKSIILEMNEGYLCTYTLNHLMTLKLKGYEEQAGTQLATALVEAGLKLSQETFVQLFEKIYKGNKNNEYTNE